MSEKARVRLEESSVEPLIMQGVGEWFGLPLLPLADGGQAQRLSAPVGGSSLLSVVLSANQHLLGISFELVEREGGRDHATDPRLGHVRVDGRTACFGLVKTERNSLTFSALSTHGDRRLVRMLRLGRQLEFSFPERHVTVALGGFRENFDAGLIKICNPAFLPIKRWLAD